jgi:hypothetical protein
MSDEALGPLQLAVVVAVIAMRMMQMAIDEIVHVVPMRDRFMPAAGAMDVRSFVAGAGLGVISWIRAADFDDVFIDVTGMRMVQMPIVQVIDVPVVTDGDVAAVGAVRVVVIRMDGTGAHGDCIIPGRASAGKTQKLGPCAHNLLAPSPKPRPCWRPWAATVFRPLLGVGGTANGISFPPSNT